MNKHIQLETLESSHICEDISLINIVTGSKQKELKCNFNDVFLRLTNI